jgi:hypothetical protein
MLFGLSYLLYVPGVQRMQAGGILYSDISTVLQSKFLGVKVPLQYEEEKNPKSFDFELFVHFRV